MKTIVLPAGRRICIDPYLSITISSGFYDWTMEF